MPRLVVSVAGTRKTIEFDGPTFTIGRMPENDLEITDAMASRKHCTIQRRGTQYFAYDLNSSNGTFLNETRITSHRVAEGDQIRIGDTIIEFQLNESDLMKLEAEDSAMTARRERTSRGNPIGGGASSFVQSIDDLATPYNFDLQASIAQGLTLNEVKAEIDKRVDTDKRSAENFFILYQLGREIASAKDTDEVLSTTLDLVFQVVNCERGIILLLDPESGELKPRIAKHFEQGLIPTNMVRVSRNITSQVVEQRVAMHTPDAVEDDRFSEGQSIVQMNIRSAICVPLWDKEEVTGVFYVDHRGQQEAFVENDLELLTAIANQVAIRIKQEELHEQLRQEAVARASLERYHSPDVVKMLMQQPDLRFEPKEIELSVLFVDVVDSTSLADRKSPAEVTRLLNEFLGAATDAIFHHEGSVNKYIGDEVMAIFGAPVDTEDHALKAVRAAMEIVTRMEQVNASRPPEDQFDLRVGVNTGMVVAGDVGPSSREEYTVLGDTVNMASRITKVKGVNTVNIGPETYEAVKGEFNCTDLGQLTIKGKQAKIRVYQVEGPHA